MTKYEQHNLTTISRRRWRMENGFVMEGQKVIWSPDGDPKKIAEFQNAMIDIIDALLEEKRIMS